MMFIPYRSRTLLLQLFSYISPMDHKRATLKDIASALNLSPSTVSKALRDHPNIGITTKERVKKLAKQLHFVPNQSAIRFKQQKSFTLGILIPSMLDHFYVAAVEGFEKFAYDHGYNVLIGQSHESIQREKELLITMQSNRVDGLIIAISRETVDTTHINEFVNSGTPIVYFMRKPINEEHHCVCSDVYTGAIDAIAYFASRGHRRIGFINASSYWTTSRDRFLGYRDGLIQHQIPFDKSLVQESDFTQANNVLATRRLMQLDKPPTAILAFKDQVLLDALSCLRQDFATKADSIELIGYGANPVIQYLERPPLASLKEQPYEIGQKAGSLLLDLVNHPQAAYQPQLVKTSCELQVFSSQKQR
ncbi:LacI family DNA-binding transcriptional regulator [Parapedobacter sp. 10938]|uniref:LacI family DNA-binding transcriptional regulator n=1 Tax=Parapedobacter flavus TaxID=3110225 RepID=UPI002DB8BC4F|nr:LacI family DNA-binding transcriptional regulator [Parapedobacter sp. 10938]MEC3881361.1 LacI family DNA-binding transcriptional regulator [Parapedobacter sp. 10938]